MFFLSKRTPDVFIGKATVMACFHMSLICTVIIPFLKYQGMNALQLSILLTGKKVSKIIFDIPAGVVFDVFNARAIFLIARLMKVGVCLLLLRDQSFGFYLVALAIDGMTYSMFYTKVSAYIYNQMARMNLVSKYPRYVSIYYFLVNVYISSTTLLSGLMLRTSGFKILIYISLVTTSASLFLFFLIPSGRASSSKEKVKASEVINTIIQIYRTKPVFFAVLAVYSLSNFLGWQSGVFCSFILIDMGFTASQIAYVGAAQKIIIAAGSFLPMFVLKQGISIKKSATIVLVSIIVLVIAAVTYNKYVFLLFATSAISFYALVEVSIESHYDKAAGSKVRGTVTSIGWFFCNVITIVTTMLIGVLAQYYSYKVGSVVVATLLLVLVVFVYKKLAKYNFEIKERI